jgi:hypothetical protein
MEGGMKLVVNLLPPSYRRRQLVRRQAMQWGAVLAAVLLVVWCGRWFELREFSALRQQLEAASREGKPTQVMLQEITKMRKQIEDLQVYEAVAQELDYQRQVLPMFGLVSRAARSSDGKLRVLELRCDELQAASVADRSSSDTSQTGSVKLIGVALDSQAVAEFHESLVEAGMFADVKLIKTNDRRNGSIVLCDYEVSCEL